MKKSIYRVESKIPIPPRYVKWSKFPFAQMAVGDSFFVDKKSTRNTTLLSLRSLLWRKSKEYVIATYVDDKFYFYIDRENKGVRVFRIE